MHLRPCVPLACRYRRTAVALVAALLAPAAFAQGAGQWQQQGPAPSPQQMPQTQVPAQPQYQQGYGQSQYQGYGQPQYQPAQPQQPNLHGQQLYPSQIPQQLYPSQAPQQGYPSQVPRQPVPGAGTVAPAGGMPGNIRPAAQQTVPTQQAPAQPAPPAAPRAAEPTGALQQPSESDDLPAERVEADVSTRSVSITSSFTGTEIIVFGSVENSRQETAESGLYDIAITIEGTSTPIVTRKKENVGGLWINTKAQTFRGVPSYYAIVSTRPVAEITEPAELHENQIGFEHISMKAVPGAKAPEASELADFKQAVIRRKQAEKLYQKSDYGVAFIGRSLFRSTVSLPANVPIGPLVAHVYLFKHGKLLSKYSSKVTLQREGIERYMHDFAFDYPLLYGIFAVFIAVAAGLIASSLFKKGAH